jgi:ABC-type sugar transport system ATPase subunit
MPDLRLKGITKSYGEVGAVRDLTLAVADGELLVLVGPSGCGKSTTLRVIAGLEDADAGSISIGERDVTGLAPAERDVAMVFQSYALFPHMSVYDNLAFGLAARKTPADEARAQVTKVAEVLGLAGLLERRPRQLSGGERQRVALGRAMVRDPAVFLMDEPLSNLDAQLRVATRGEIVRLQAALGTTTVYVTHDQNEALSIGHRVGVLRGGELQQLGTPREVYDAPANTFVASFIGSPPMNLLPATLDEQGVIRWHGVAAPGQVTLGIRPEHVHIAGSRWAGRGAPAETFEAVVDVVESVGDQTLLDLDAAGARLIARVEPAFQALRGDRVRGWLDPARLHLFDAETGRAMPGGGAA